MAMVCPGGIYGSIEWGKTEKGVEAKILITHCLSPAPYPFSAVF